MIHLLAVLPGAALLLIAALRVASGTELGHGEVSPAHTRFILAGLMLIASPGSVPLLGEAVAGLAGLSWHAVCLGLAAVSVAAAVAFVLPHDPGDYRQLVYGRRAALEAN